MASYTIYHNPRCSKSRQTLELLQKKTDDIEIVDYLKNPPSQKTVKELTKKLGLKAHDIIRTKEEQYKPFKNKDMTEAAWVKAIADNPKLLERPIVVKGAKAVIGRPPENVKELF